ncbi:MAG: ACP S-malonyltransferase [Gammaproteobacteria bacterium]|nr:ACP S-malonyltransferase [Gammaproteobacteria bacterium]
MNYALVFPGQGSQAVGMLGKLAAAFPVVAQTWQEASAALGWDVGALAANGPAEELNRTERTQPALLAAGIAVWRVWQGLGLPPPKALAGHSLGEYAALVAAGALPFADALKLVELRGRLMQAAVPQGSGGMAAVIGLDDAAVEKFCGAFPGPGVLEPVNYNSPGQVVVAGHAAALDWVEANAKAQGARMVMRLPVSVPSHCSLMCDAAEKLAERLRAQTIHPPAIPVLHNLDAQARSNADAIRAALRDQLHRPVRWTQTVQAMSGQGIGLFLECGPGKVLSGLTKRIAAGAKGVALEDPAGIEQASKLVKGEAA